MEMRKQGSEGQAAARSASKSPVRKQSREEGTSTDQKATENQETNKSTAQSTSGTAGAKQDQRRSTTPQGGDEDLLQHAKQAGGEIVAQVQQRAGSQINRQKEAAADQVSQVAESVRRIRETLSEQENGLARYAADYSDMAANRLEQLSNYIREKDPKQLLGDVQNFGRRRPALLVGGAFLLGFAGARLIKSAMDNTAYQRNAMPGGTSYAANE